MILPVATLALLISQQSLSPTTSQSGPKAPPPRVQDPAVPAPIQVPSNGVDPAVGNAPLTADEAAVLALRLQPGVRSAQGQVQAARGRTQQVGAALNPQLILGAGYGSVGGFAGTNAPTLQAPTGTTVPGVSPVFPYSTALSARQLLYDFNQTRNLVRQNRALEQAALANLGRTEQDIVLNVKSAFYNLVNAERLVRVNEQNVANRQRQLDLTNARLRNEIGLPSDVVTAETAKSQAVLALTIARDAALQARVSLLQLIGVDPLTPITASDTDEPELETTDLRTLTAQAIDVRPEVRQARSQVQAAERGLSAAKALNLPSVYTSVAAGFAGQSYPFDNDVVSFGVGVQFPIYEGGARAGAVKSAQGQVQTAQSDLQNTVLAVQTDVAGAYLSLASAGQRVTVADTEVANAREAVRIAEGRYAAGLGSFLDIITAQGLLVTAQTDRTNVQNALDLARTRLRRAVGRSVEGLSPVPRPTG